MHPILMGRLRPALYLLAWAGIGALLGVVLTALHPRPVAELALLVVPLALVYAFVCLSAWWVCRGNPPATTPPERLLAVGLTASLQAAALWMLMAALVSMALNMALHHLPDRQRILSDVGVVGIAGFLLYGESMTVHYFLLSLEGARAVERSLFTSQVAAREAELRALRAQLNPHFLFNSLNSISALAGTEPEAARRMCQLLGEFLRASLSVGARERVRFAEELALAERYLAVEQVRFGPRLQFEKSISAAAEACLVPPLLIQPLIENAVKHGVADRVEGGAVIVRAEVIEDMLEIHVENPRDPDAPPRRGSGLGLENVKQRVHALDSRAARVDVRAEPEKFSVRLRLPALVAAPGESHAG